MDYIKLFGIKNKGLITENLKKVSYYSLISIKKSKISKKAHSYLNNNHIKSLITEYSKKDIIKESIIDDKHAYSYAPYLQVRLEGVVYFIVNSDIVRTTDDSKRKDILKVYVSN